MATQQELQSWLGLILVDATIDRSDLQTWVGLYGGVLSAAEVAAVLATRLVYLSISAARQPYLTVSAAREPYLSVSAARQPYITVTEA
jgi:hypothetical protein